MRIDHFISLKEAIVMTSAYRSNKNEIVKEQYKTSNLLAVCETYDRSAFDAILSQNGCASVRIYFGMKDDLQIHSIIVGVNDSGEDMLDIIVEKGGRCPDDCPSSSELNS